MVGDRHAGISWAEMSNFRPIDRDIDFLFPPSVNEWLPERHLARFVVEVVNGLDLSAMSRGYRGSGSAPYHPSVLVGLLVYGYASGVFSSRQLPYHRPRLAVKYDRPLEALQLIIENPLARLSCLFFCRCVGT